MTQHNALFLGTLEDKSYIPHLKSMFNGMTTYVNLQPMELLTQLEMYCASKSIRSVVSTNTTILSKLLSLRGTAKNNPSLGDYAGSLFTYKSIDIVFVSPLSQIFTVPYGKFLCERFISKVVAQHSWAEPTEFKYLGIPKDSDLHALHETFRKAFAIAIDIETFRSPLSIRCVGYTGLFWDGSNNPRSVSFVLPVDSEFNLAWIRKFNELPAAKIFQNGKYDNSYLLRFNAAPSNWLWDTAHMFHCWYSELPKDLAFLNAFLLRKVVYWKDLAETNDLAEYYRYCALDTWATGNVFIQWVLSAPDWAKHNYTLEFPLVYPCLLAEMTGLGRDMERLKNARADIDIQVEKELSSLQKALATPGFNPNSPKQVKTLLKILGCGDIASTDEKDLQEAAFRHPFIAYFVDKILEIRGLRKLTSTYLRTDDDADSKGEGGSKEFSGRILYALNPHGTDTGRLASREHHFWCGLQVQNIPRGQEVKQTVRASGDFVFGECDLEQAESRDTANISGDTRLIEAVSGDKDFHSINASAFFGRSYESIYDDKAKKTKDKALRDLSKRVNHGANYNMGPKVLVATMGLKNIYKAAALLGLKLSEPVDIATYLLERFHDTYPKLRGRKAPFEAGTYYAWVAEQISVSKRLVSRAYHHTEYNLANSEPNEYISKGDWTRYCFGKPDKNKSDLNAYVAHCPQSLNARLTRAMKFGKDSAVIEIWSSAIESSGVRETLAWIIRSILKK